MQEQEKREALYTVDGHKTYNWTLSKLLKTVSARQEILALIKEQHSQEEKTY